MKELAVRRFGWWSRSGLRSLVEALGFVPAERGAGAAAGSETSAEIPGHGCLRLARSLNFMGDTCLRTNLVTKRALAEVAHGAVIEVITDNLSSVETIPFMSPNYNGAHLATVRAQSCWKIYLRKGDASRRGADNGLGG